MRAGSGCSAFRLGWDWARIASQGGGKLVTAILEGGSELVFAVQRILA